MMKKASKKSSQIIPELLRKCDLNPNKIIGSFYIKVSKFSRSPLKFFLRKSVNYGTSGKVVDSHYEFLSRRENPNDRRDYYFINIYIGESDYESLSTKKEIILFLVRIPNVDDNFKRSYRLSGHSIDSLFEFYE